MQGETKSVETKPTTIPQLQAGGMLKLILAIDMAAEMNGAPEPLTDDGYPFRLSYHLFTGKQNSQVPLSKIDHRVLSYWKGQFYGVESGYLGRKTFLSCSRRN